MNFQNQKEWLAWSKSKRPSNIPSDPNRYYRGSGWVSWPDWLGNGGKSCRVNGIHRDFLPFNDARAVARCLKLRNTREWEAWFKSKRPKNIPLNPNGYYRENGWISWPDWLGNDGKSKPKRLVPTQAPA